jgi:hypothetical protein
MHFSPQNDRIEKLMVQSESALEELSNEWSCQNILTISNILDNLCVPPSVTEVHHQSLRSCYLIPQVNFRECHWLIHVTCS